MSDSSIDIEKKFKKHNEGTFESDEEMTTRIVNEATPEISGYQDSELNAASQNNPYQNNNFSQVGESHRSAVETREGGEKKKGFFRKFFPAFSKGADKVKAGVKYATTYDAQKSKEQIDYLTKYDAETSNAQIQQAKQNAAIIGENIKEGLATDITPIIKKVGDEASKGIGNLARAGVSVAGSATSSVGRVVKDNYEGSGIDHPTKSFGRQVFNGAKWATCWIWGPLFVGSWLWKQSKKGAGAAENFIKERFQNQTNTLLWLGFFNLVFDYLYRLYFGKGTFNDPITIIFDTIILFIVLYGIIGVGFKASVTGIMIYIFAMDFLVGTINSVFLSFLPVPDYILGTLSRTLIFLFPVFIFSYFPFLRDEKMYQMKHLIVLVFIAYIWETGLQAYIYSLLIPSDPNVTVLFDAFRKNEGVKAIFMFLYFVMFNGWFILAYSVFSKICKPTKSASKLMSAYFILIIVIVMLLTYTNLSYLKNIGKTDNAIVKDDMEDANKGMIAEIEEKTYRFRLEFACNNYNSEILFIDFVGLGMTKEEACKALDILNKKDQQEYSPTDFDMEAINYAINLKPSDMYNYRQITTIGGTLTSGSLSMTDSSGDETEGTIGCYVNNPENPGVVNGDEETAKVQTFDGEIYKSYSCSVPKNVESDLAKQYEYFGVSRQVDVVTYFKHRILLSSQLILTFKPDQINLKNHGQKSELTEEKTAAGSSYKKAAILKTGTPQQLPIVIQNDPTTVTLDVLLQNQDAGNIYGINDVYVLLQNPIGINEKSAFFTEITDISTIDEKVLDEVKRKTRLVEMGFKIYKLDKTSEKFKEINDGVKANNKLAESLFLDVYQNVLFGEYDFPQDQFLWVIVDFDYMSKKTQTMTLSDEIYNKLVEEAKKHYADLLSSTPVDDTGFAEVAYKELEPEIKATLDIIAWAEGTSGANGYNLVFGGRTFVDFSRHPKMGSMGPEGPSDAAGRYQFLSSTWEPIASKLSITDFSPESQDKGAVELIKMEDAYEDAKRGDILTVCSKLGRRWVSLPGAKYQTRDAAQVVSMYKKRLEYYENQTTDKTTDVIV